MEKVPSILLLFLVKSSRNPNDDSLEKFAPSLGHF